MRFQTAAYRQARMEETRKDYSRWIVRFSREDAEFEAKEIDDFKGDLRAVLGAQAARQRLVEFKGNTPGMVNNAAGKAADELTK